MLRVLATATEAQQVEGEQRWQWAKKLRDTSALLEPVQSHGLSFQYQYVHDLSAIPLGAPGAHGWFGRYTWTLSATLDTKRVTGWEGASVYASVKQHVLEFGQMYNGVAQGYSNLDAEPRTALYEAWIRQQMLDGKLTLKAGRIDFNADFDAVPSAGDFLNASMGYSPTVMDFASYPAPRPGIEARASVKRSGHIALGEFSTPEGRMFLAEGDKTWSTGVNDIGGRAAIGLWRLAEPLSRRNATSTSATRGFYGVLEQSLWAQPLGNGKARIVTAYLQSGTGDEQVNPYSGHLGGGWILSAPLRARSADAVALGASCVRLGPEHRETVVEMYYKLRLNRSISLIPDLQYFREPKDTGRHRDVLVATPRLMITF